MSVFFMKNKQNSIPLRQIVLLCLSSLLIVLISSQMDVQGLSAQNNVLNATQERTCAAINFIDPQFPQYGEHVFITIGLPTTNHPDSPSKSTAYWRSDNAGLTWSETINTARLVGEVTNNENEQERLYIDFHFVDRYNWEQWSGLGRTFDSQGDDTVPYDTWTYWQVSEGTIEGRGSLEGTLDISHRPANYLKGFQIGEQAHSPRVTGEGIGGWYDATGMLNSDAVALAPGDVYAALDCSGEPRPTATATVVMPTDTPTNTPTDTPTVASTSTATSTPTVEIDTATPSATPSATPTTMILPTETETAVPPTSTLTATPQPAATDTAIPSATPTATLTAMPPTSTPTDIPPTATSEPTAIPTAIPTVVPEDAPLIRVAHYMVAPGEQVTVLVETENIDVLATTTIEIKYDPSILRVVSCSGDPGREFNLAQCNVEFAEDTVKFNVTALFGVGGSPDLAEIVFEGVGQSGDISPIEITVRTFADTNGQPINTITEDGSVDITSARRGDVNCDGELNDIDTLLILRYDIGVTSSGGSCSDPGQRSPNETIDSRICDVSGDSGCTPLDGLYIHRCNLGLESPLCTDGTDAEETPEETVDTNAVLSLGTLSTDAAKKATLPVMLNITEGNFNVSTIEIDYDPTKLQIVECLADPQRVFDMAACNMAYDNDGIGLDTVRFNVLVGDGVDGIVQLAELRFETTGDVDAKAAGLRADVKEFSDGTGDKPSVAVSESTSNPTRIQIFLPAIYR